VDDGVLAVVSLHPNAGRKNANDGHQGNGDDAETERDLHHCEGRSIATRHRWCRPRFVCIRAHSWLEPALTPPARTKPLRRGEGPAFWRPQRGAPAPRDSDAPGTRRAGALRSGAGSTRRSRELSRLLAWHGFMGTHLNFGRVASSTLARPVNQLMRMKWLV